MTCIERLELNSGDEGHSVRCSYREKKGMGELSDTSYETKEYFFSDDKLDEAVSKYLELHKKKKELESKKEY